jgi:hypothetical protein
MKVGFTGTREGMTQEQTVAFIVFVEERLPEDLPHMLEEFHHGDCVGADEQAHQIAKFYFKKIVVHPPIDPKYRAYTVSELQAWWNFNQYEIRDEDDYLVRNYDIVDETDILIAAPKTKEEELRSGTWATIRYARKQGKPVFILEP